MKKALLYIQTSLSTTVSNLNLGTISGILIDLDLMYDVRLFYAHNRDTQGNYNL